MPEADVVTASTGMSPIRRPGLYGPSSFRIASARSRTAFARSGLVGPRFANVVAAALYSGAVAEGRGWKYCGFVNACAASFEPDDLAVALDEASVRLVGERDLREAGEDDRIDEPEDDGQDDHGDDGTTDVRGSW